MTDADHAFLSALLAAGETLAAQKFATAVLSDPPGGES